jgi:multiple sugar transport system ATP-binding protein
MSNVTIREVHKRYDDGFHAVKGVSLEIKDKEFVVLVGPSGCGKTTTLRMVAGLETVTEGHILIGNQVVNDLPPMDRDIAMVFQNYALYPHMSVYDNMAFGLKMRKFDKAEIAKRVQSASEILGIKDHLQRKPRQLSGGQRQRVALGRAIVRNPQVFLFDEPLSNLDAKLRVQMRIEIKKLHQRLATTSVYVTHDQVEAMTLGDRVVVMNHGVIQQVGEPLELYDNPANKYVAGFIGSPPMNFANVQITKMGDALLAENPAMRIAIPGPLASRMAHLAGKPATLGIRPEDLRMANGSDDAGTIIDCHVEVAEQLGSEVILDVKAAGAGMVASVEPTVRVKPQEKIKLALAPSRLRFFDAETEKAL